MIKAPNYQISFEIEDYGNDLCEGSQTRLMKNMKDQVTFGEIIYALCVGPPCISGIFHDLFFLNMLNIYLYLFF